MSIVSRNQWLAVAGALPGMAGLFGVGRITFWVGYLLHPLGRAFGMVLTVLPTLIAFEWLRAHVLKT